MKMMTSWALFCALFMFHLILTPQNIGVSTVNWISIMTVHLFCWMLSGLNNLVNAAMMKMNQIKGGWYIILSQIFQRNITQMNGEPWKLHFMATPVINQGKWRGVASTFCMPMIMNTTISQWYEAAVLMGIWVALDQLYKIPIVYQVLKIKHFVG